MKKLWSFNTNITQNPTKIKIIKKYFVMYKIFNWIFLLVACMKKNTNMNEIKVEILKLINKENKNKKNLGEKVNNILIAKSNRLLINVIVKIDNININKGSLWLKNNSNLSQIDNWIIDSKVKEKIAKQFNVIKAYVIVHIYFNIK